jgi:hypothetical protein
MVVKGCVILRGLQREVGAFRLVNFALSWPLLADVNHSDGQECLFVFHLFWEPLELGIQAV